MPQAAQSDKFGWRALEWCAAVGVSRFLADIFIGAFTIMCWNAKRRSQPAPMLKSCTEQGPDLPFPSVT